MSDLPALSGADFAQFFEAIHAVPPFPWQSRLAAQLAKGEGWPRLLDLPTGSGKTAVLDLAVFTLALEAGSAVRSASLRVVYVVDRRTIVDQAYERARRIASAIDGASSGVLGAVRARLASYGREGTPLRTALLRGAIARSDMWARSPDQPLIAVSTVDQVGSRLLFRGYGVSDAMKPIHAGLLGNDALYLLDEVHLSQPFRETLVAIADRYGAWSESVLSRPIQVVEMSATPGEASAGVFRLDPDDERHPLLARRLQAPKPAALVEVAAKAFVAEIAKQVAPLVSESGRTVAVVVNRVAAAREVHDRIRNAGLTADVHLLTGRMRPLDRDALERTLFERIRAGRQRDPGQRSMVVVATQCIEAGADFDFDGLITECASLDALRQRFGRLDRLGELSVTARGMVIAQTQTLADDPVYGPSLGATWTWLNEQPAEVDFGINALPVPADAAERGLLAPRLHAPILLPSHLDAWVQTSPIPSPDPDVSLWLHGPDRATADVQIVWRADLGEDLLRVAHDAGDPRSSAAREIVLGTVEAIAPASGEAMAVPVAAARRWLDGRAAVDVADVEGARAEDLTDEWKQQRDREPRPALAWRGETSAVIAATELRPGDTIVVPASYGGIACGTWDPGALERVSDLAEIAVFRQRGRAQWRLHPDVVAGLGVSTPPPVPAPLDSDDLDDVLVVRSWLEGLSASDGASDAAGLIRILIDQAKRRTVRVERLPLGADANAGEYFLLTARRRVRFDGEEVTTEDDQASFTGVAIPLSEHLVGVGATAGDFAARVGLPDALEGDMRLAGRWHDAGKADPRFQRLLHGGSEFRALVAPAPLAKSALAMRDRRARHLAQERSGYPRGARHELASLALMTNAEGALAALANDWDLVQHLVASHHGRCRPLAPWVADPAPVEVRWSFDGVTVAASSAHDLARLDSGVGERFWLLVRRYGWWGLAWLETVLRLGDHRRSEEEQGTPAGEAR
jgi:CRISPR-associated endonuclease/helicase Cas3